MMNKIALLLCSKMFELGYFPTFNIHKIILFK